MSKKKITKEDYLLLADRTAIINQNLEDWVIIALPKKDYQIKLQLEQAAKIIGEVYQQLSAKSF